MLLLFHDKSDLTTLTRLINELNTFYNTNSRIFLTSQMADFRLFTWLQTKYCVLRNFRATPLLRCFKLRQLVTLSAALPITPLEPKMTQKSAVLTLMLLSCSVNIVSVYITIANFNNDLLYGQTVAETVGS